MAVFHKYEYTNKTKNIHPWEGHKYSYTARHKYISKKKTQCCGEKNDTNTITQQNTNTFAKTVLRWEVGHKLS